MVLSLTRIKGYQEKAVENIGDFESHDEEMMERSSKSYDNKIDLEEPATAVKVMINSNMEKKSLCLAKK